MMVSPINTRIAGLIFVLTAIYSCGSSSGGSASSSEPSPPVNQAPNISGQPPTSVVAGDAYSFTPTASDADNDPLSFSVAGQPSWATFSSTTGSLQGTPGDGDVGTTGEIVISVSDANATTSLSGFAITIDSRGTEPPPPNPNPNGYVGFGSVTQGAASCPTTPVDYHVTSLSGGSGQGTIRDAVSEDCRNIIFDVAGEISLGTLQITNSYLTIDGSSAPSPGITLVDVSDLMFEASGARAVHDIIVNNIRAFGIGGDTEANDIWDLDGSSGAPIYNVVLDHLTMRNASDGNMDIYGEVYDVTLSNNLMIDSIEGHHFSESSSRRERITVVGNVYARLNERQPRIRYNTVQLDFVNNVIYGWGWFEAGAAGMHINAGTGTPSVNVENNVYIYVPGLNGNPDEALKIDDFSGTWHFAGNVWPAGETQGDTAGNSGRLSMNGFEVERKPVDQIDVMNVGTHFPWADEQSLLSTISIELNNAT